MKTGIGGGAHWRRLRFIPLAIAAAAMALGLAVGFSRLGIRLPINVLPEIHGALMICGFLGTLISLERAVAFGRWWGYGAPALSAIGTLTLLFEPTGGALAFVGAGAIMIAVSVRLALRHVALFSVTLCVAALCWTIGTLLWLAGRSVPEIVLWWLAFPILTIAAERLELSRILRISASKQVVFTLAVALILVAAARSELVYEHAPFAIAGFLLLAVWLLSNDVASRTIRQPGPARFSAIAIIAGHVWLGIAGILLYAMPHGATLTYDAAVHTIAIGVVLSMIFAHAPIIFPAVTGLRVRVTGLAYGPLGLLHVSLLLRLVADIWLLPDLAIASAAITVVALVTYGGTLGLSTWSTRSRARRALSPTWH